jgi:hypothetical protein
VDYGFNQFYEEIKVQDEPLTYGIPNSVLLAQGVDPEMLAVLPEDVRAEVLSTIHYNPPVR